MSPNNHIQTVSVHKGTTQESDKTGILFDLCCDLAKPNQWSIFLVIPWQLYGSSWVLSTGAKHQ